MSHKFEKKVFSLFRWFLVWVIAATISQALISYLKLSFWLVSLILSGFVFESLSLTYKRWRYKKDIVITKWFFIWALIHGASFTLLWVGLSLFFNSILTKVLLTGLGITIIAKVINKFMRSHYKTANNTRPGRTSKRPRNGGKRHKHSQQWSFIKILNIIAEIIGWITLFTGLQLLIFLFAVIMRYFLGYGDKIPKGLFRGCVRYTGYFYMIVGVIFVVVFIMMIR